LFKLYNLISLQIWIDSWNHHSNQDEGYIHASPKCPHHSIISFPRQPIVCLQPLTLYVAKIKEMSLGEEIQMSSF
jgi:hypothetical protein